MYMFKLLKFIFLLLLILAPLSTSAASTIDNAPGFLSQTVNAGTGISEGNVSNVVTTIIKGALAATGFVFFALMVYAGFRWMTARGNEEGVTKARDTVIAAIIGLGVVVAAYAITNFVIGRLAG